MKNNNKTNQKNIIFDIWNNNVKIYSIKNGKKSFIIFTNIFL